MQNCCLWIGGVKVSDLDGIRDNFNITDVKGYYLGGRLADWLRLGGYDNEAARIDNIDRNGDVDKALEDIFTGTNEEAECENNSGEYGGYHFKTVTPPFLKREAGTVVLSADGSFRFPVMTGSGSFTASSFAGSFGSYKHQYEYEYEYGSGKTSFGSFNIGSFDITSFLSGSFSYEELCVGGSFTPKALMLFLSSEHANRLTATDTGYILYERIPFIFIGGFFRQESG